jgi:hypothetical protein
MENNNIVDPVEKFGLKVRLSSVITLFLISDWLLAPPVSVAENPNGFLTSVMFFAPTFEVITITVFLKSTLRPCESVRTPSSMI